MSRIIHAAVVQTCSIQDVEKNINTCRALISDAAEQGAQLIVLPENFAYLGDLKEKLRLAEELSEKSPGPILGAMIQLARQYRVNLLLGGMPIKSEDPQRFYNTSIMLNVEGRIISTYRKMHLCDLVIAGKANFHESKYVLPGEEVVTASLFNTTIGLSICYDLRFPELYRAQSKKGATILTVPAAFSAHTGKDHWMPLLQARAIENLCFVLAAAQHGQHLEKRASHGRSCIIDPWGTVLAQVPDKDGVAIAKLDMDYLERIRNDINALLHRRLD